MKELFKDVFFWHVAAAITCIAAAGCYIWQGQEVLGLLWAAASGCQIASAWLTKVKEKDNENR